MLNRDWAPALSQVMAVWDKKKYPDAVLRKLSIAGTLGRPMGWEVQDAVVQTRLGGGRGQGNFCRTEDAWAGSRRERKILLVSNNKYTGKTGGVY